MNTYDIAAQYREVILGRLLSLVEAAYMIAVKRTSLLFGAALFHEAGLGAHLAAGVIMVLGVFLIVI